LFLGARNCDLRLKRFFSGIFVEFIIVGILLAVSFALIFLFVVIDGLKYLSAAKAELIQ
jgi:uncharacterized membrane protein